MFKRIDTKGLKIRIWVYFILFTAVIMGALWLLQIVFLNSFYTSMKKSEIQKVAESIATEYGKSDFTEMQSGLFYNNGISVRVYDQSGNPQFQSDIPVRMASQRADAQTVSTFIDKISQSKDGKIFFITSQPWSGKKLLVYGITISVDSSEPLYLYVGTQIDLADSPAAVLQDQLVIVMVISLLLSIAISLLIASRLTRPITKIMNSASELAKGNYNIKFENGGYTEINQLASTLNFATQELSKTDQLRRDLIANISHDLRTPLTMVKMYAELIRDVSGETAEKRNVHAQVIIEETDRLSALITDILDLSKIQSGTAQITSAKFDLCEKAQTILNRFHALSERDGYVFKFSCSGDTEVLADEKTIEQVIYNLISNAINYTGEDKMISIHIEKIDATVRFEVTDSGSGIAGEELNQIWERYYKAKRQYKRSIVGTGLGLSIVKGILELHHSAYGVKSTVGIGSTFWFELTASSASLQS